MQATSTVGRSFCSPATISGLARRVWAKFRLVEFPIKIDMQAQTPAVEVKVYTEDAVIPWLSDVSRLRMQIFREYPYLYSGSLEEEAEYMQPYVEAEGKVLVLAHAGDEVVGASTGMPLIRAEDLFQDPWVRAGYDPADFYYFAESVLLPEWRGRGIGRAFMQLRELHARELGSYNYATMCGVVRPADEAVRPADYRSPEGLWRSCGFSPRPDIETTLGWTEIGETHETEKSMRFWWKSLQAD